MAILTRWLAPAALAAGLGFGAMTQAPAQAQDTLTRVLVDVAHVQLRGGHGISNPEHCGVQETGALE